MIQHSKIFEQSQNNIIMDIQQKDFIERKQYMQQLAI